MMKPLPFHIADFRPSTDDGFDADVVIVGGAVAGAATAILLRRRLPGLRVVVVEKAPAFDRKVGESTVEIGAFFLTRVLRLQEHLNTAQLPKQGFRYWFHNEHVTGFRDASEVGPTQLVRTPSFQLDRSRLDEHLIALAAAEGATVMRPAVLQSFRLPEEGDHAAGAEVTIRDEAGTVRSLRCRWLVDASGRAALLARKRGGLTPIEEHPTAAIWIRYRGAKDLDGAGVCADPEDPWVRSVLAPRRLATNHFVGYGYWIWAIPLPGGETSIGLVWDKRLVEPQGSTPRDKLERFLAANPLTRELLADATPVEEECRYYGHLPYLVDRFVGTGWAAVGDAAGFLDPFYSPGLDQVSFSVWASTELVVRHLTGTLAGGPLDEEIAEHNRRYDRFFRLFFEAIYRDKYELMGDYDTMTTSFLFDTALYYLAFVLPLYRRSTSHLSEPPFYGDGAEVGYYPLRFFRRRMLAIARRKRALGIYGNHNAGRRPSFVGFSVRSAPLVMLGHGLVRWAKAELAHLGSHFWRPRPVAGPEPSLPPAAPAPATDRS